MSLILKHRPIFFVFKETATTHTGVFFTQCTGITAVNRCKLIISDPTDPTKKIEANPLEEVPGQTGNYFGRFDTTEMAKPWGDSIVSAGRSVIAVTITIEESTVVGTSQGGSMNNEPTLVIVADPGVLLNLAIT